MFDVGFWELVLIFGLGLMILGPERLPRVANRIGRWVGKARRTAGELRRQLERELDFDDLAGRSNYHRPKPPPAPSAKPTAGDHAPANHADLDLDPELDGVDVEPAAEAAAADQPEPDAAITPDTKQTPDPGAVASSSSK